MDRTERIARSILSKITLHPEEAKRKGLADAKQYYNDPTWVRNIQKDYDGFCRAEGSELSKASFKLYQKAALEELKKRGKIFASRKSERIARSLIAGRGESKLFYKGSFSGQGQKIEVEKESKEDRNIFKIDISYPPLLSAEWLDNDTDKRNYLKTLDSWLIEIEKFKKGVVDLKKYLEKE